MHSLPPWPHATNRRRSLRPRSRALSRRFGRVCMCVGVRTCVRCLPVRLLVWEYACGRNKVCKLVGIPVPLGTRRFFIVRYRNACARTYTHMLCRPYQTIPTTPHYPLNQPGETKQHFDSCRKYRVPKILKIFLMATGPLVLVY